MLHLSASFYGANRPGSTVSQGVRDAFWLMSMQAGFPAAYDCVKAFSETDFTEDLGKFDIPTLVIHGDDDQIVPINVGGLRAVKMIKDAKLEVYKGAPHGLMSTHKEQFNSDLLELAKQETGVAEATARVRRNEPRTSELRPSLKRGARIRTNHRRSAPRSALRRFRVAPSGLRTAGRRSRDSAGARR